MKIKLTRLGVLIFVLVVMLPVTIFLLKLHEKTQSSRVPNARLTEQPSDTRVASHAIPFHHWQTKNGAKVYFAPTEHLSIIDIQVSFDAGTARDGDTPGIASLMGKAVKEGTTNKSAKQIAEQLDSAGAQYKVTVDRDRATFWLRVLNDTKKLQQSISIFTDLLSIPAFPTHAIEQLKQQQLVLLSQEYEDPEEVAKMQFFEVAYDSHPYAKHGYGSPASYNTITRETLQEFHSKYFVAQNATISIAGPIHRDKARELSNSISLALNIGEKATKIASVAPLMAKVERMTMFPSKRTHIIMGHPMAAANDPEYFNFQVANYILGGSTFSRLVKKIKLEQHLVHDINSSINTMRKPGPFLLSMQAKNEDLEEVITLVQKVLEEYIDIGPTEEEVQLAKRHIISSFPLKFASNEKIVDIISYIGFYELPFDFLDTYVNNIKKVTKEAVYQTLQRRLQQENLALVVVGDLKT